MHPTDEQTLEAYRNAPQIIRDALTDGLAIEFILKIRDRYGFHVDTTDQIVERIRDLLLGLSNPTQFIGELVQLGLNAEQARLLTSDLNAEVFLPLRDQMRNSPSEPREPAPVPAPPPIPEITERNSQPSAPAPIAALSEIPATSSAQNPNHAPPGTWHPAAALHIYVPAHPSGIQHQPASPQSISAPDLNPFPGSIYMASTPSTSLPVVPSAPEQRSVQSEQTPIHHERSSDPYREPV